MLRHRLVCVIWVRDYAVLRWRDKWASAVIVLAVSRLRRSLRVAAPAPRKYPSITIPTATQALVQACGQTIPGRRSKEKKQGYGGEGRGGWGEMFFSPSPPSILLFVLSPT